MSLKEQQDIREWIDRISSQSIGDFPICPFSKVANVTIHDDSFGPMLLSFKLEEIARNWNYDKIYNVHVVVCKNSSQYVRDYVTYINVALLRKNDLIAFVSDKDHPVFINGVRTTQDKYLLVIVQRFSELQVASAKLKELGYYKDWTEENLNEIVVLR